MTMTATTAATAGEKKEYWRWAESVWLDETRNWREAKFVTAGIDVGSVSSQAVVMCPNDTEGVQWELDLLTQEHGRLRVIFLASPELTPDRSLALFERVAPPGAGALALKPKQIPIAAFDQPGLGWRVLTAKRLSVETYTTALNIGLQALFGQAGEPLTRPKAERR